MKKTILKSVVLLMVIALMAMFGAVGCKATTAETTAAATTAAAVTTAAATTAAATTAAAETTAAVTTSAKKLVFGNIPAALSDEWNGFSVENFKYAADKMGVEVQVLDPAWDDTKALASLEDLITKKVDAVGVFVLTPESAQKFSTIASEAKMPLAFENTDVMKSVTGDFLFDVNEDYYAESYDAVKYIIDHKLGTKLLFLRGAPGMGIVEACLEGVQQSIKDNGGLELAGYRDTQWETKTAQDAAADFIQSGVKFDVVFCQNEPVALGAINALRDAGITGVNIVASNGSPNGLEMIKKGEIVATASVPVSLQGLYLFKALYLYAAKGLVPPSKHIVIDDMMIDKSNVDQAISWIPSDKLIELIGGLENWDTKGYGQYLNN